MYELISERTFYTKQEIVSLLKIKDKNALEDLYAFADNIRKKHVGDEVRICGFIEFSNHCLRNCLYCRIRKSNEKMHRYRIDSDGLLKITKNVEKLGFKTVILESGEDSEYDVNTFITIIKKIKESTNLSVTLSIGERTEIELRQIKEAGADSFLLNHKTSDPMLYRQLHPDMKFSNRIKCLRALKQLGYDTGSGIIVGFPGQTLESIANDILLFKELDIDTIEIIPYLPHAATPLSKKFEQAGGYFVPAVGYFDIEDLIYKIIAITRIVTRKASIPVSMTMPVINSENGRSLALQRGANLIFLSITDKKSMDTYDDFSEVSLDKNGSANIKQIKLGLTELNRVIA